MTYREYLKNLIIENVEDYDAQEVFIESVDCAESIEDLDSLERYISEQSENNWTFNSQLKSDIFDLLMEAKDATTPEEKKSVHEKIFSKYYSGLDKASEWGGRKLTPTADKIAKKEGRIANNSDYDAYYQKYSKTKDKVKKVALGASINAAATAFPCPIPGSGFAVMTPLFVKGAKYSPNPNDEKMVNDIINSFKQKAAAAKAKLTGKKSLDVDINGALVAGNNVKAAVRAGNAPDRNDLRTFDNAVNKLKALMKRDSAKSVAESTCNLDNIKILLEGCIDDRDLDNAIDTMFLVTEAYDFMDENLNNLVDIAELSIELRL